jgi:putative membrane protein
MWMMNRFCTSVLLAATMCVGSTAFGQGQSSQSQQSQSQLGGAQQSSQSSQDPSAAAQQAGSRQGQSGQQSMSNDPDKMFLKMAAMHNKCEMQLAQLAQQKSQSEEVKQLAQHILQDHQQADQKLREVAQKAQVQIPEELPKMKQEEIQMFSALQGEEFDKQFVSHMKAAHAHDIAKFGDVAKIAKNEDVKRFAQELLPKLQEHGQMVTQLASTQGLGSETLGQQAQPASGSIPPSPSQQQGLTDPSSGSTSPGTSGSSGAGTSGGTSGGSSGLGTSGSGSGAGTSGGTSR